MVNVRLSFGLPSPPFAPAGTWGHQDTFLPLGTGDEGSGLGKRLLQGRVVDVGTRGWGGMPPTARKVLLDTAR